MSTPVSIRSSAATPLLMDFTGQKTGPGDDTRTNDLLPAKF